MQFNYKIATSDAKNLQQDIEIPSSFILIFLCIDANAELKSNNKEKHVNSQSHLCTHS